MRANHPDAAHPEDNPGRIHYPRRVLIRQLARLAGRTVLPLLFRISRTGQENFPKDGPLLVVGNHAAVMEVVLMVVYSPWLVELIGGVDIPLDRLTALGVAIYQFIPIRRGSLDRPALRSALSVLEQGGVIGMFPQGGIWQAGEHSAQTGVAWLSDKTQAPVLPVYFGGVQGALRKALHFERPGLSMSVGKVIPSAKVPPGAERKRYLGEYSAQVMQAILDLCPADERSKQPQVRDDRYELQMALYDAHGAVLDSDALASIPHGEALSQLLHTPVLLDIFSNNLRLPVEALVNLADHPPAAEIARACKAVLDYLAEVNPYLLVYRFGARRAEETTLGLGELHTAAKSAAHAGHNLVVTPIRRYFDIKENQEVVVREQAVFNRWG